MQMLPPPWEQRLKQKCDPRIQVALESSMDLRVQLKICEGCGGFWFRTQEVKNVYCHRCTEQLSQFPAPLSRKRRGRPVRSRSHVMAVSEGGVQ